MRVELEESGGDIKQTWGSVGIGHLEQRPLCGGKTNLRLILMFVHSAFAFGLTTLTSSSGYVFMFVSMFCSWYVFVFDKSRHSICAQYKRIPKVWVRKAKGGRNRAI